MQPTQEALDDLKEQIARRFNRSSWEDLLDFAGQAEWLSLGGFALHPSNISRTFEGNPESGRQFFITELNTVVVAEGRFLMQEPRHQVLAVHNLENLHETVQHDVAVTTYRKVKPDNPAFFVIINNAEGMTLYGV